MFVLPAAIETHCPGTVSIKGASKVFAGPDSLNPPYPQFPNSVCKRCMQSAATEANPLVAGK
jgi:type VI secretion system secreted protein VgrG